MSKPRGIGSLDLKRRSSESARWHQPLSQTGQCDRPDPQLRFFSRRASMLFLTVSWRSIWFERANRLKIAHHSPDCSARFLMIIRDLSQDVFDIISGVSSGSGNLVIIWPWLMHALESEAVLLRRFYHSTPTGLVLRQVCWRQG